MEKSRRYFFVKVEVNMRIDNTYAAIMLIEILYDKGIVNEATYHNVKKKYQSQCETANSHISQRAS